MNKRSFIIGFLLAVTISYIASAAGQQYNFAGNATGVNTNHTFGFVATSFVIANDGAASIWADWADCVAVATSAGGAEIKAGEKWTVELSKDNEPGWTCVGIITGGGNIATRVTATRGNP